MEGTLQNENKLVGTLSGNASLLGGLGTVIARDGKDGADGKSAYEIWLAEGNEGSEADFLASLKGADGTVSFEELTEEQKASLKGDTGDRGEKGDPFTYEDFTDEQLASLKGDKGDQGIQGERGVSGVYVGAGTMPTGYNVQINPDGNADAIVDALADEVYEKIQTEIQTNANVRIGDVSLLANAWVGANSPYSQRVTIPTVTPYTQVDLTPSVEQLSIFHHKDLAFVTENEDGVVTVYAIGQKPENDYTIQVTMTEVAV